MYKDKLRNWWNKSYLKIRRSENRFCGLSLLDFNSIIAFLQSGTHQTDGLNVGMPITRDLLYEEDESSPLICVVKNTTVEHEFGDTIAANTEPKNMADPDPE